MDRKFYECSCHSGGILLDFSDKEFDTIEISFWHQGFYGQVLSLKERIRRCWYILRKGTPYTDMMILNKEISRKLGKDLITFAKQKKLNKKEGIENGNRRTD